MLKRSRKSSGSKAKVKTVKEKPFEARTLKRAKSLADQYRIILEPDDQLGYIGTAVELPTGFADGRTPDECVKATREALKVAVATMLEAGQNPPQPALAGKRDAQVNVRLASFEKLLLQDAARRHGYKGLSDFLRAAALERIRMA